MVQNILIITLVLLVASLTFLPVCLAQTDSEQVRKIAISGSILSEEGFPVSNASVILLDCSFLPIGTHRSDGEGKFLFDIDPDSICLIRIQKENYIPIDIKKESLLSASGELNYLLQRASKIHGTVLDGVSLAPLKSAQIKLLREQEEQPTASVATVKTDEEGKYAFINIPGGKYLLKVEKETYIPYSEALPLNGGDQKTSSVFLFRQSSLRGSVRDPEQKGIPGAAIKLLKDLSPFFKERGKIFQGGDFSTNSAQDGTYSIKDVPEYAGYRILISADGFAPQIIDKDIAAGDNLLIMNLQKASSLRGTVKGDQGKILKDAIVEIQPHNEEAALGLPHLFQKKYHPTETGLFRIDGLPQGNFTLTISSAGYIAEVYEILSMKRGESRDLGDIKLSSGLSISGMLNNEKGEAIGKAHIKASLSGSGGKAYAQSADAGEDGSFSVTGLKEGIYSVKVEADGYTPEMQKGVRAGAKNLVFTLKAAGTIKGTVTGEDGSALKTFYISVEREREDAGAEAGDDGRATISRAFSSETGIYEVGRLKPGLYTVSAEAPGFSEDSRAGVEVFAGLATEDIGFSLRRGVRIDGFVYDKENELPVAGAFISLVARGAAQETLSAMTDAGGYFILDGAPLRSISIMAEHPDHAAAFIEDIDPTGKESTFPLKIYLEPGGTVEGYVLEADDSPVHGARLSISQAGGRLEGISDMSGYYHIDHLRAGSHYIQKTLPRLDLYSDYESKEFTIRNNDIVRIDFKSFTEASGLITRKGLPLEGALVSYVETPMSPGFDTGKLSARSSYTDSTGSYRIKGLKDGRYSVVVEDAEKRIVKVVEIPKAKEFRYDIRFPEFEISGRVIDAETGMPIPLVTVHSSASDARIGAIFESRSEINGATSSIMAATGEMQSSTTDSEGYFSILVEKPGKYLVTAKIDWYLNKTVPITVTQSTPPVEIALYKGSVLKGTVRSERGKIPPATNIQIVREGYSYGTSAGSDGKFVFDDLEPATYRLYIFAPALAPLIVENMKIESGRVYEEEYLMQEGAPLSIHVSPANKALRIRIIDAAGRDFFALFLNYLEEEISVEEGGGKTVYAFPNLPPGVYTVTVTSGKASREKTVEIFSGAPASVEFAF